MGNITKLNKDVDFKKYLKQEIKKGYAVDNRYFSKNIEFYNGLANQILNYYLSNIETYSFQELIENNRDLKFLYNNGYRGSEYRVRNGFYIWFKNLVNDKNCYIFALSKDGKILDNNFELQANINTIEKLYDYMSNSTTYDVYPIKRVIINHETDPKVGIYIVGYIYNYLKNNNPELVSTFVNDVYNYYDLFLPQYVNHVSSIFICHNDIKLVLK